MDKDIALAKRFFRCEALTQHPRPRDFEEIRTAYEKHAVEDAIVASMTEEAREQHLKDMCASARVAVQDILNVAPEDRAEDDGTGEPGVDGDRAEDDEPGEDDGTGEPVVDVAALKALFGDPVAPEDTRAAD